MTRIPSASGFRGAMTLSLLALVMAFQFANSPLPALGQPGTASDKAVHADLVTSLRRLKLASSRTQRALMSVINDVGQTPVAVDPGDPRFFEPSEHQIAEDPLMWEKDFAKFGAFEQPHKKWIDADMAHLKEWVDTLNTDMAQVAIPAAQQAGAAVDWDPMNAELKDINLHFTELQTLTQGPKYDNLAIAKAALAINSDLKEFDKHWKSVVKTCGAR
jgi:hypothetical protein